MRLCKKVEVVVAALTVMLASVSALQLSVVSNGL